MMHALHAWWTHDGPDTLCPADRKALAVSVKGPVLAKLRQVRGRGLRN